MHAYLTKVVLDHLEACPSLTDIATSNACNLDSKYCTCLGERNILEFEYVSKPVYWIELNWNWIELNWIELNWNWIEIELNWIELNWNWIELNWNWTQLNWIELNWNWTELNWTELNWIAHPSFFQLCNLLVILLDDLSDHDQALHELGLVFISPLSRDHYCIQDEEYKHSTRDFTRNKYAVVTPLPPRMSHVLPC